MLQIIPTQNNNGWSQVQMTRMFVLVFIRLGIRFCSAYREWPCRSVISAASLLQTAYAKADQGAENDEKEKKKKRQQMFKDRNHRQHGLST